MKHQYYLHRHPLYQELRRPQFLHSLIPNRDIDVIKSELNKFFDVCKQKNPDEIAAEALDLCVFCAFICKEQGWRDGTQSLEQWLIDKFPPEGDFTVKVVLKISNSLEFCSSSFFFVLFGKCRH